MADKEKKPINKKEGEEGAEGGEDEEEQKGCCAVFCEYIAACCAATYKVIVFVCRAVRDCLAFVWYPCKERCCNCIDDCDKKMNPWKDASYSHV
ncbi:hypothetical protein ABPG72_006093 [Tetrahymena utriculariae]